MAGSRPVVIDPDHLAGGDGTFRVALWLWSSRNPPITYNILHSLYFKLVRETEFPYVDDDAPDGEIMAQKQIRMKAMYHQIQSEVHGPEFPQLAMLAAAAAASSRERVVANAAARPAANVALPSGVRTPTTSTLPSMLALPPVTGLEQIPIRLAAGSLCEIQDGAVFENGQEGGEQDWAETQFVEHFPLNTPRASVSGSVNGDSPDRFLRREDTQLILEEDAATHTQTSEEDSERLRRMTARLRTLEGNDNRGVNFILRVELLIKHYRECYGEFLEESGENVPVKIRAIDKLCSFSAASYQSEDDLRAHIQALGRICGRNPDAGRKMAKNLWEHSTQGSPPPQEETRGVAASPPPRRMQFASPEASNPSFPSPGLATSQADMVNVVEVMTQSFTKSMKTLVDDLSEQNKGRTEGAEVDFTEKVQPISNLDFQRACPTIRDDDLDLDKYHHDFDITISCNEFGGRKVRDISRLHVYGNGFSDGSTRRKALENCFRRAQKNGRIPGEAKEVLAEIRKELRTFLWETNLQKLTRLDREFEGLEQGGLSHADFRALFDSKIQDMEEACMDMPSIHTLFRKYLQKLNPELRGKIQSKDYKIDGPELPPRAPKTYQDLGLAVIHALEEKMDISASSNVHYDSVSLIDSRGDMIGGGSGKTAGGKGGGKRSKGPKVPEVQGDTLTCSYCQAINEHFTSDCPQQSACKRGHEDEHMRQYRATGKVCETCRRPGHEMKHHLMAIQDYSDAKLAQAAKGKGTPGKDNRNNHHNQNTWEQTKGKAREPGKGGPKGPPGKLSDPVAQAAADKLILCPRGAGCCFIPNTGDCRHWQLQRGTQSL